MNPLPCSAIPDAYVHTAKPSTADPAKPSTAQPRRRATFTSRPPAPPTATPTNMPTASSVTVAAGPWPASSLPVAAPARAIRTTGVAIPSLRPLSTLIRRRILAGTAELVIMPHQVRHRLALAPRPPRAPARCWRCRRGRAPAELPGRSSAAARSRAAAGTGQHPPAVRGARPGRHQRTGPGEGELRQLLDQLTARCGTQHRQRPMSEQEPGPDEGDRPVTSNRSSLADSLPHPNTNAATMARPETLTKASGVPHSPRGCRGPGL